MDAVLLSADADKDSFAEIVSLINAVDIVNDDALAAYVISNDAALAAEEAARVAADGSLTTRLAAEEGARGVADASIVVVMAAMQADVDANEAASDAAELSLTTRLGVEEAARAAADASLVVKYDAEIASLIADVDQNEADSDAAELSLTTRLGVEEVRAAAAEASIVLKHDTEMAAELAGRVAQEALVKADLAEIHGKWQSYVHAPMGAAVLAGHIVDIIADGLLPMSELAYVTVNGMMMMPVAGGAGDYMLNLDNNGNIIAIVFSCPIDAGDRIAYYGQKAYSIVS